MATFHGVDSGQGVNPDLVRPDSKTLGQKISASLKTEMPAFFCFIAGILIFAYPTFSHIFLVVALLVWLVSRKNVCLYPFDTPLDEKVVKGRNKGKQGQGMFFLGNDRSTNAGIWLSDDAVRTHWLVMGSTGSGKTRFLMGVLYQSLLTGSGCLYVDGKADTTVFWLVYSICRRLGREDDLLVINYLTGGEDQSAIPYHKRSIISNTTNPFAYGQPDNLRSTIVSLMRDDGGDGMWKGRASALVGALMKTLCFMRDANMIQLSIMTLRKYLNLDEIVKIVFDKNIQQKYKRPLIAYLKELPGYVDSEAKSGKLNPKCYEQHGYLQMQLTEALADMSEVYGHIFGTPMGEVDYKDLVFNRRVLFVMLPSIEKEPDALANLGKMVVGGVRSALAPALGNKVEGTKRDVIDVKPTKSFSPFYVILDEYGYYAVKGFAVVAAQARSLGISCVFAGQDYPSFKKASEEEAASTVANTNIKMCLKLEDPDETLQIFEKRAGQERVSEIAGYEMNKGLVGGYNKSQQQTRIEMKNRIDVRDLVAQGPGQAHIMFGDTLVRAQLFYADPHEVADARLNRFVVVLPPDNALVQKYKDICKNSAKVKTLIKGGKDNSVNTDDIPETGNKAFRTIKSDIIEMSKKIGVQNAFIYGYGAHVLRSIKPEVFEEDVSINEVSTELDDAQDSIEEVAERAKKQQSKNAKKQAFDSPILSSEEDIEALESSATDVSFDRFDEFDDFEQELMDMESKGSMRGSAKNYARMLMSALDDMVHSGIENELGRELSYEEKEMVSVRSQVKTLENSIGLSDEASEYETRRSENMVIEGLRYPSNPPTTRADKEVFTQNINEIKSKLEKMKDKM
jgi:intracellular multiplication protein IcmO